MAASELLWEILRAPNNMDLRMVYADQLEEEGDVDRGRFIRAQCQYEMDKAYNVETRQLIAKKAGLAGSYKKAAYSAAGRLVYKERPYRFLRPNKSLAAELLKKTAARKLPTDHGDVEISNAQLWAEALWLCVPTPYFTFKAGFIDTVVIPWRQFHLRAEQLFRTHPVTRVTISDLTLVNFAPYRTVDQRYYAPYHVDWPAQPQSWKSQEEASAFLIKEAKQKVGLL